MLNLAHTVNSSYIPENQTRIDVAQNMQARLNTNLQKQQEQKMQQQQQGNINMPSVNQDWGRSQ